MNKNSFAPRPPMGWNSYDYYDTTVNEEQVRANAEYMAANLASHGWEYVVIDIAWYTDHAGEKRDKYQYIPFDEQHMDEYGRLLPSEKRFPSSVNGAGFKPLADYIHSLGLKFGIHIMRGIPRYAAHTHMPVLGSDQTANEIADAYSTCRWNPYMYGLLENEPGSQAYYDSIFELYVSWGVDFVKCDDICNYGTQHEVAMLHKAIMKCGRPIVLSLSPGPAVVESSRYYMQNANMWRITDDLWDQWPLLLNMFERCEIWQEFVGNGNWPDCDMLPFGKLGKGFGNEWTCNLTPDEQKTMMTLWCIFRSPLMLGAEMTKLDDFTTSLLTNDGILRMQIQGQKPAEVCRTATEAIWVSKDDTYNYIALFNLSSEQRTILLTEAMMDEAGITDANVAPLSSMGADAVELWTNASVHTEAGIVKAAVAPHGVYVIRY